MQNSSSYYSQQGRHGSNFLGIVSVYVPDEFVGPIIGLRGVRVKEMQSSSGTEIKVQPEHYIHPTPHTACLAEKLPVQNNSSAKLPEPKTVDEFGKVIANNVINEALSDTLKTLSVVEPGQSRDRVRPMGNTKHGSSRMICVKGPDDISVLKGVFMIFKGVAEFKNIEINKLKLHIEFKIPDRVVGSLIGKRGSHIQELKRISFCDILVSSKKDGSDAIVCLYGIFGPCLSVSSRVSCLCENCVNLDKRRSGSNRPANTNGEHGTRTYSNSNYRQTTLRS